MPSTSKKASTSAPKREEQSQKGQRTPRGLYIFSVIILVIIVVTFIGAPVVEKIGGSSRIVFGYFKGKPIEYVPGNYFSQQKDLLAEQVRSQGDQKENLDAQVYQVWRGAFDRATIHTAIVTFMEESGFHVSENLVDESLTSYPAYLEDGEFSEKRYRETPLSERYAIRRTVKENLIFQAYLEDIGSIPLSSKEIEFMKSLSSPERKFKYILFPFDSFPDTEVQAYLEANESKFKRARFSLITITTGKKDAEKIHERINAKEITFEDAARSYSKDPFAEKGGDMGFRYAYELDTIIKNPEDTARLFSLEKGGISQPVESSEGWLIFRCDEPAIQPDFSDPDVKKTVRTYMMSYERGKIEDYLLEEAKKFKEETKTTAFEALAAKKSLPLKETDYFPINYGNSVFLKPVSRTDSTLAGAAYRENFFVTAFSLKPEETSDPVILNDSITLLKLVDERMVKAEDLQVLDVYLPYIVQGFTEENLQQFILSSKDFKDDFNSIFFKYFLRGQ
ncbi:MAG: hypothetical protein Kow009_12190 [Spirochaetales bacterium]